MSNNKLAINTKLSSLLTYLTDITRRLTAPLPLKHLNRATTYKQYLQREADATKAKIESLKAIG